LKLKHEPYNERDPRLRSQNAELAKLASKISTRDIR